MNGTTDRQRARSEAHAAWDAEATPGAGTRAAALIAAAEGFDDLARRLLDRLGPDQLDATARCTAQTLAWRAGATDGPSPHCLADLDRLPSADADAAWAQLFDTAVACALPTAALTLLDHRPRALAAATNESATVAHLRGLGRLNGPHPTAPDRPLLLVADLPTGRAPDGAPRRGLSSVSASELVDRLAASGLVARPRGMQGVRAWWRRRRRAAALALAWTSATSEHLPALPEGSIALVEGGVIDRYTARHWQAALARWPRVLVSGLRMQDPAAATPELIAALRGHEPVVAADVCTARLLDEWGVKAVLDGARSSAGRPDLWDDRPPTRLPTWWTRLGRVLAGDPSPGAATVLQAWHAWLEEARADDAARAAEPAWALPAGPVSAELIRRIEPRPLANAGSRAEPPIELAFAVDAALAPYLPVALESCIEHASLPLRVHLLTRRISPATLAEWQRLFDGRADIVAYAFDDVRYGEALNLLSHTSVSTLDRLLLPDLLPAIGRVIYLDIDLVVTSDLAELWHLDLAGRPLAAKPGSSPGNRWGVQMLYRAIGALPMEQARRVRRWLHDAGPMAFRAFNAGVLLLDLARMRADGVCSQLLSMVAHCAMNDQDALNAYARGRYLALPEVWNAAPRQDVTDGAKIIHFVGPVKPWHELYISRKPEFERVRERVEQRRRGIGDA